MTLTVFPANTTGGMGDILHLNHGYSLCVRNLDVYGCMLDQRLWEAWEVFSIPTKATAWINVVRVRPAVRSPVLWEAWEV